MADTSLQIYLPAFLFAFLLITFTWKWIRRLIRSKYQRDVEQLSFYNRIRRIEAYYFIVFVISAAMIGVYAFSYEHYYLFVPFERFDHPLINSFGLLVLKTALVAVVVAQIHIDKELYKYSRDMADLKAMELIYYSERMLLGGLVLMFLGIVITLTNLVSLLIAILSFLIYFKVFSIRLARKT